MNKLTEEALRMAIKYMEYWNSDRKDFDNPINACKAALENEQLDEMQKITEQEYYEQEPVAWMHQREDGAGVLNYERNFALMDKGYKEVPLYTRPTKPLSDDEIVEKAEKAGFTWHKTRHGHKFLIAPAEAEISDGYFAIESELKIFARAIEKAHGIGE